MTIAFNSLTLARKQAELKQQLANVYHEALQVTVDSALAVARKHAPSIGFRTVQEAESAISSIDWRKEAAEMAEIYPCLDYPAEELMDIARDTATDLIHQLCTIDFEPMPPIGTGVSDVVLE